MKPDRRVTAGRRAAPVQMSEPDQAHPSRPIPDVQAVVSSAVGLDSLRLQELAGDRRVAGHILRLQRVAGNRTVNALISGAQAQLAVGPADDPLEREADQVAAEVVARLRATPQDTDADVGTPPSTTHAVVRQIHRIGAVGLEGGPVDPSTEHAIGRARRGGAQLATGVRRSMEYAFGTDFGAVRLHSGPEAATLNDQVQAKAFTVGSDIFFRQGIPDTSGTAGQTLLAHELAHTVQQGGVTGHRQSSPTRPDGIRLARLARPGASPSSGGATVAVQRKEVEHNLARILGTGIIAENAVGGMNQRGHAMHVWVDVDLGKHPITPPDARPGSVYGLTMQYWEYVDVPFDNDGTSGKKQWNDIYGLKPDASTFDTAAQGCTVTWTKAVDEAAACRLVGKQRIGFKDLPGLFERAGRNVERTLKFRIVFDDGDEHREMFATQVLRVNGGKLGYGAYVDSVGNNIESHGFGADDYAKGSTKEKRSITAEAGRIDASSLPTAPQVQASIPREALQEVESFVVQAVKRSAAPYLDLEQAEFLKKVDAAKQQQAATGWMTSFAKAFLGDVPGGVAAGQFLVPQVAGAVRYQAVVPTGLLVAIATGNNVLKMYFTDNTTKNISMDCVPELSERHWKINMRSFGEIPTELIQESLANLRAKAAPLKPVTLDDDSSHLRAFYQQGTNHIVKVDKKIGPNIKRDQRVSLFQPEVRDVTGQFVKAQFGKDIGFVRINKITGDPASAEDWKKSQKADLRNITADDSMSAILNQYFIDNGDGLVEYGNLMRDYPGLGQWILAAYRKLFGKEKSLKAEFYAETARETGDVGLFTRLARTHDGDHPGMTSAVMRHLRKSPGRGSVLESVYNEHVPLLRLDVPSTLGGLVNRSFATTFKRDGGGFAVYNRLSAQYPDFTYRLKPAYREVFGEDRLDVMLAARQKDDFAKDVPFPDSSDNKRAAADFLLHSPFTLEKFIPSAGTGTSMFDATFDPMTGEMRIIVKVYFNFKDSLKKTPTSVTKEPAGFGQQFGRNTWNNQDKDTWKQAYVTAATDPFNKSGHTITCIKPGWAGLWATPHFDVVEVPLGHQHFVVEAVKSALVVDDKQKKLQSDGTSGAGRSVIGGESLAANLLQEHDIYDKFKDPLLHTYLHSTETEANVEPALLLDRRRLEEVLGRLGAVPIRGGLPGTVETRRLADGLKRAGIPSTLASLHPIVIDGVSTSSAGKGTGHAGKLRDALVVQGVKNPITIKGTKGPTAGLTVSLDAIDDTIKNTYVTNWSRFTSAHEFGHMIGLIDEYYGASSADTVKEMISAGWLPPDTRSDHLRIEPSASGAEENDQKMTAALIKRAGLESPDFAMKAPGKISQPKTTSLMTGGFEVNQVHMITAWEALVKMTKGLVDEKFWKIT